MVLVDESAEEVAVEATLVDVNGSSVTLQTKEEYDKNNKVQKKKHRLSMQLSEFTDHIKQHSEGRTRKASTAAKLRSSGNAVGSESSEDKRLEISENDFKDVLTKLEDRTKTYESLMQSIEKLENENKEVSSKLSKTRELVKLSEETNKEMATKLDTMNFVPKQECLILFTECVSSFLLYNSKMDNVEH